MCVEHTDLTITEVATVTVLLIVFWLVMVGGFAFFSCIEEKYYRKKQNREDWESFKRVIRSEKR